MEVQGGGHPYVPKDLKLAGFVPCFLTQLDIVSVYGVASALVFAFMWIFSGNLSITIALVLSHNSASAYFSLYKS